MISGTILCYKMCYCLGVPADTLKFDFPALSETATNCAYFEELPNTRKFRAVNHVFFFVVRNPSIFVDGKATGRTFHKVVGKRFDEVLENSGFSPDVMWDDSHSVLEFLAKLSECSRKLIPQVYEELKAGISYTSFETLMRLPELNQATLDSAGFNMRRLPSSMNIYFFECESLNISTGTMFKSDKALLKTLRIALGRSRETMVDTSKLADAWKDVAPSAATKYFMTAEQASAGYKHIFYVPTGIETTTQTRVMERFMQTGASFQIVPDLTAFEELWGKSEDLHEGTLLICRRPKADIDKMIEKYPGLDISIVISMEQVLYKSILAGYYEHVTAFSMR